MPACSLLIEGVPAARHATRANAICMTIATTQINDATKLHALVAQRCGIPAHRFMLSRDGKIIPQHTHAAAAGIDDSDDQRTATDAASSDDEGEDVESTGAPLVLRFLLRSALVGGKGGFGALLRSSTTKVGAKKTSNFSASRDLSGRRMRHVEAEEAIAKWNSEHHDPVNQTELNAKFKAIKEGRSMEVKVCKWGPTCKYRYSTCRMEHGPDPDAEPAKEKVLSMAQQVPVSSLKAQMTRKEQMQDAVAAGIKSSLKRKTRATAANGEESKEQDQTDSDDDDEQDGYESSDGSESDASPPSKRAHTEPAAAAAAAASSSASSATAAAASSASSYSAYSSAPSASASSSSSSSSFHVLAVASYIPAIPESAHVPSELGEIDAKQAGTGVAAVLAKVKAKQQQAAQHQPHAAAAAESSAAAAASASSFAPIDLSSISRHEDLLQYDSAHLGAELTRVGLKAGGTHEQRAQRLFMMKGSTIDQMPKKIRANS